MDRRSCVRLQPFALSLLLSTHALAAQTKTDEPQPQTQPPVVIETVTVSASMAEEGRDAATFTSLSREEIAERDRGQDLAMLLADTPGAYAYSDAGNAVGYAYLSLRGFDQRRVAVNINGVPLNGPESRQVYFIDLADFASGVQSIQVQRGTGTALYGSPAVGGVVNLETGSLPSVPRGELRLGAGSFGTYRAALRYSLPLDSHWSLEAGATHVRSDGYREPSWTRHTLGQLTLQRVGHDSVLRVLAFAGPERTQLAYNAIPAEYLRGEVTGDADHDRRINPLLPGESDHFTQPQVQLIHDWRLGHVLLKNTAYAILGDGYFLQHNSTYDYSPLGFEGPTAKFPALSLIDVWRQRQITNRQFGWIPTLRFEHGRGQLTAGLELLHHSGRHEGHIASGRSCLALGFDGECASASAPLSSELTLYDFTNRKLTASAFVRGSWRLTSNLAVDVEVQATHHRYSMDDDKVRGYSYDTQYSFVTPRLGLTWKPSAPWSVYASLSTARSEPTFSNVWDREDAFANPRFLFTRFDPFALRYSDARARPERLRAAEIGVGWRRESASFKANAYWMDFRDELVYAGGLDDDGQPITDNAARSLHRGLEFEGAVRLPGKVQLTGYLTVSDDRLKDYRLQFGPTSADQVDYSGNRIALFPESQARLRLSRRFGALDVLFGMRRVGRIFLDNSEDERLDPSARLAVGYVNKLIEPFTLGELQVKLDLSKVVKGHGRSLALLAHVDNLFDKRYVTSGYVYGVPYFYPGATRTLYAGATYGF
jgi:iron complex outermembrane recepter protein